MIKHLENDKPLDKHGLEFMRKWIDKYQRSMSIPAESLEPKWHALAKVHPRHAEVLDVRFGLHGNLCSHEAAAAALGVPKGSLGGMVSRAVVALRGMRAVRNFNGGKPAPNLPLIDVLGNLPLAALGVPPFPLDEVVMVTKEESEAAAEAVQTFHKQEALKVAKRKEAKPQPVAYEPDDQPVTFSQTFSRRFEAAEPLCEGSFDVTLYAMGRNGQVVLSISNLPDLKLSLLAANRLVARLNRAIEAASK